MDIYERETIRIDLHTHAGTIASARRHPGTLTSQTLLRRGVTHGGAYATVQIGTWPASVIVFLDRPAVARRISEAFREAAQLLGAGDDLAVAAVTTAPTSEEA